jgi:hypothetical protein
VISPTPSALHGARSRRLNARLENGAPEYGLQALHAWARLVCGHAKARGYPNYGQSKKIDCVFRKLNALALFSVPLLPNTHDLHHEAQRRRNGDAKRLGQDDVYVLLKAVETEAIRRLH